jgi:CelD/BcsL family acetyltransferase involved in cellulose biosynthesis
LRLVTLREIPEDPRLRQQWNELLLRMKNPQVFCTYEWALAVQRAYPATLFPLLFLAYDSQDFLCGIAALATDRASENVSFLCATTGDYCDILSLPAEAASLISSILAELRKLNIRHIQLANLPADSPTVDALRIAARQHSYRQFARTGYICAQVSFRSLDRARGEKPETPRPKMVRRFLKAMSTTAPARLDHARSWDAIQPLLSQFMRAHIARFLATGRISNMAQPERRLFLEELAKLLSESGWLTFSRLVSGEMSYAWNYGFQFQGTWFWYQPTFDSDWEKFSPGFCLLAKLIEEAAGDPLLHTVDLGLGAEDYKERFANQSRETLHVTVERSVVAHLKGRLRYGASASLKTIPKVDKFLSDWLVRLQNTQYLADTTSKAVGLPFGLLRSIASSSEVVFYEWCGATVEPADGVQLKSLELSHLADAAAQYFDDPPTLNYLLRCAQRLRSDAYQVSALVDAHGTFLHFASSTGLDQFVLSECKSKIDGLEPGAMVIFDGSTPLSQRGRRYSEHALGLIASEAKAKGRSTWTIHEPGGTVSPASLEEAGFQRRFSISQWRILGWRWIKRPASLKAFKSPRS